MYIIQAAALVDDEELDVDEALLLAEDLAEATADTNRSEFSQDLNSVISVLDEVLDVLDRGLEEEGIGVNDVSKNNQ